MAGSRMLCACCNTSKQVRSALLCPFAPHAREQAAEVAGLAGDADAPLEQLLPPELLARYGLAPAAVKKEEGGDEEMRDAGG